MRKKKLWAQERKKIIRLFVEEGLEQGQAVALHKLSKDKDGSTQLSNSSSTSFDISNNVGVFFSGDGSSQQKCSGSHDSKPQMKKRKMKKEQRKQIDGLEDSVKDLVVSQAKKLRKLKKKLRHLRKQLSEKEKESSSSPSSSTSPAIPLCLLCEEQVSDLALIPCGHIFCSSDRCSASSASLCPLCKAPVASAQRVYFGMYIADDAVRNIPTPPSTAVLLPPHPRHIFFTGGQKGGLGGGGERRGEREKEK